MAAKDMPWFQSSKESGDPRTWIALASCLLFRTGAPLNPAKHAIESDNKDENIKGGRAKSPIFATVI